MFLENEFYLMNKDDRILRFTCDNSPLGVSFKEEESYEEIRPYGYDGIGQLITENVVSPKEDEWDYNNTYYHSILRRLDMYYSNKKLFGFYFQFFLCL